MTAFLTSSHNAPDRPELNPANGFADEVRLALRNPCRGVAVSAAPDNYGETDFFCGSVREGFEASGIVFSEFHIVDRRTQRSAADLVRSAGLVILMGGHVPTQNCFFQEIRLRELMADYEGVVVGISAGSMNSADIVYCQPELDGEALDPCFPRFIPGLNLTRTMLLPHYQRARYRQLDGMRLYEDITYGDSRGHRFYCLPDGSYLYLRDGREELRGECWLIEDGHCRQISREGDILILKDG